MQDSRRWTLCGPEVYLGTWIRKFSQSEIIEIRTSGCGQCGPAACCGFGERESRETWAADPSGSIFFQIGEIPAVEHRCFGATAGFALSLGSAAACPNIFWLIDAIWSLSLQPQQSMLFEPLPDFLFWGCLKKGVAYESMSVPRPFQFWHIHFFVWFVNFNACAAYRWDLAQCPEVVEDWFTLLSTCWTVCSCLTGC